MKEFISQIKQLIEGNDAGKIDQLLSRIIDDNNASNISQLFLLFDDKCDDNIMFSIVHSVETLSDDDYVQGYLANIEKLFQHSPRWASILLIRIVNNSNTLSILRKSVRADSKIKQIVLEVRERASSIKKDMPAL